MDMTNLVHLDWQYMAVLMGINESLSFCSLIFAQTRKILWLKLSPSNHDPKIIAWYYPELLEKLSGIELIFEMILKNSFSGCPLHLWTDYGTEKTITAALHIALHYNDLGKKSYIDGPSKHSTVTFMIASYLNANIIENRVLVVIAEAFKNFLVDWLLQSIVCALFAYFYVDFVF